MALADTYVQSYSRIPQFLASIRDGQAPEQFSQQLLKDLGYTSSSDRALIPMLKAIGFLSPDGKPTARYLDYRDHSRSEAVLGQALREAYSDIFLIKSNPSADDREAIQGKFKSFHNVSDQVARLMTATFLALLSEADVSAKVPSEKEENHSKKIDEGAPDRVPMKNVGAPSLHYNIQIHLPATKDVEVFNAIFKSIREHLMND